MSRIWQHGWPVLVIISRVEWMQWFASLEYFNQAMVFYEPMYLIIIENHSDGNGLGVLTCIRQACWSHANVWGGLLLSSGSNSWTQISANSVMDYQASIVNCMLFCTTDTLSQPISPRTLPRCLIGYFVPLFKSLLSPALSASKGSPCSDASMQGSSTILSGSLILPTWI